MVPTGGSGGRPQALLEVVDPTVYRIDWVRTKSRTFRESNDPMTPGQGTEAGSIRAKRPPYRDRPFYSSPIARGRGIALGCSASVGMPTAPSTISQSR